MYASQVKANDMKLFGFNFISGRNLTGVGEVSERRDCIIRHLSCYVPQHLVLGWDYGSPEEPPRNIPAPTQYDTHGLPWKTFNCQKQADVFLRTGTIYNPCNGPCWAKRPSDEIGENGEIVEE